MFDDRSPIYRQIAEQIRADLLAGTLHEGDQVMSTNQYAAFHRINPATAAKAFAELVDEGLLEKRRGIGMFVTSGAVDRLRAARRGRFAADVLGPVLDEAHRLGMSVDDVIAAIRSHPEAAHRRTGGAA